jgi:hypothetical protein
MLNLHFGKILGHKFFPMYTRCFFLVQNFALSPNCFEKKMTPSDDFGVSFAIFSTYFEKNIEVFFARE